MADERSAETCSINLLKKAIVRIHTEDKHIISCFKMQIPHLNSFKFIPQGLGAEKIQHSNVAAKKTGPPPARRLARKREDVNAQQSGILIDHAKSPPHACLITNTCFLRTRLLSLA